MVEKIAHRGGYPQKENTLEAFQHCLDNKYCDTIELDVHLCKGNDIVVYHDEIIPKIGKIYDTELKILSKNSIPTLIQCMDLINNKKKLYIDVKVIYDSNKNYKNMMIKKLCEIIVDYVKNKKWTDKNIIIASFEHDIVMKIKKILRNNNIHPLYNLIFFCLPINLHLYTKSICDIITLCYDNCNIDTIRLLQKRSIKVYVYTVNNREIIKLFINHGIDGIISDHQEYFSSI